MPPQDADWEAERKRARTTAKLLAKLARNFAEADRRDEPVSTPELLTLHRLLDNARSLLGEDTEVSPLITALELAGWQNKVLTFDIAKRYIGMIVEAIDAKYPGTGSSGTSPAAKRGKRSRLDVRIDAGDQGDADP